jgi:predicted MFS family arabinose efflux permease
MAGLLALINVIFAFWKLPESLPYRDSEHAVGLRTFSLGAIFSRLHATVGPLILSYAIVTFAFAQMEASFTWLSSDVFRLSEVMIYTLFGYLGLVMALVQGGLIRRLEPKLGDQSLVLLGCALMAVSLLVMPFFDSLLWLFVTAGILAAGYSFANPALISSISKGAHDTMQGETMGITQSLASLSRFVGPLCAGVLYQNFGPASPYVTAAAVTVIAIGVCQLGFRQIRKTETPVSV